MPINGTPGNDLLAGTAGADEINGLDGDDTLLGQGGDDTLNGGFGNDVLNGGTGGDTMTGGAGNDVYVVDTTQDTVIELHEQGIDQIQAWISYALPGEIENLVLLGSENIDGTGNNLANVIIGNAGRNDLVGGAGNDVLKGMDGVDVLDGGSGADAMAGGAGSDFYYVDDPGDKVIEVAGEGDTDTVRPSIDYTLTAHVENLQMSGADPLTGIGNELDNTIFGNAGDNILAGKDGNDTISGAFGNDILNGGTGADKMSGGRHDDLYIVDNAGDQVIEEAVEGVDTVQSTITFILPENVENLTIIGGASVNGVGNAEDNKLVGNNGNNGLAGLAGSDTINGAGGNDVLTGGHGQDFLTGGAGADTFRYLTLADSGVGGTLRDVITDFGAGDRIDLSALDADAGTPGNQGFTFIGASAFSGVAGQLRSEISGNAAFVSGDVNGDGAADFQIALIGPHLLAAGDFLL